LADVLTFTPQPVRVTQPGIATWQAGHTALDVLAYDILDIEFCIVDFESPGASPLVVIGIATSLQNETEDGCWYHWLVMTPSTKVQTLNLAGTFLRYCRWIVSSGYWGNQTAVEFYIKGMGRKRNEM
jgi:hypothetical protein